MKLLVLGTGNAHATNCYNTCFLIENNDRYFMVDAGGGNGIFTQLEKMNVDLSKIHDLFVTHAHTDHFFGAIWLIRVIASKMNSNDYTGTLKIYAHKKLISLMIDLCESILSPSMTKHFHESILFIPVSDGQTEKIANCKVVFFDIHSTKLKQFGCTIKNKESGKIAFLGDEPFNPKCKKYVKKSRWMFCEAFCLFEERDKFNPYKIHHSTVKDACELAEKLKIRNLVLWHTEDTQLSQRQAFYTAEGKQYFSGNLFVPNDLDIISLT